MCIRDSLKATGKPVDAAQVDAVLKSLNNRKVDEVLFPLHQVISKGLTKVSVASSSAPAKKEAKKEEKKPEAKKPAPKAP